MKLFCLVVASVCAVPLEPANAGGLEAASMDTIDFMELEKIDFMELDKIDFMEVPSKDWTHADSNATTNKDRMVKDFLDRLDDIDFSSGINTTDPQKRDLLQKEWLNHLRDQIHNLVNANHWLNQRIHQYASQLTSLTSRIGEIKEVYHELTTCAKEIPGVDDPFESIHALAVAYKEGGYPGVAAYVEKHLSIFVREASTAIDFKTPVNELVSALDSANDVQLIRDGQLDEGAVGELVRLGLGVVESTMNTVPSYTCFKDSLFEGMDNGAGLDKIVNMVVRMAKEIFAKIDETWRSVMGPHGIIAQRLNSMKNHFESMLESLMEPIFGDIDDIVSGAVDLSCEFGNKMLTSVTEVVHSNAILLPGYCWAKNQVQDMLENPVMVFGILFNAIMTPLVEKFLAWVDANVLKPLATQLNTAGLTINGLVLQAIDGLAGLIPEAGGPIAMAITAPLSTVMNEVTVKLSDGSVNILGNLFKETVRGQVAKWVDSMASTAGNAVEAAKQRAQSASAEVASAALALVPIDELLDGVGLPDDSMKNLLGIITPFLRLIKPVFGWVFKLAMPGLSGSLAECAKTTKITLAIFEAGLCPGSDSEHAQILPPEHAAAHRQQVQLYFREHLRSARLNTTTPPGTRILSKLPGKSRAFADDANYVLSGAWMPTQAEIINTLNNWFESVSEGFIQGAISAKARGAVNKLGAWMIDDMRTRAPNVGTFLAAVLQGADFVMDESKITTFQLFPPQDAFIELETHYTFTVNGANTDGAKMYLAFQQDATVDIGGGKESFTGFVSAGSRFSLNGQVKVRITNNNLQTDVTGKRCLLKLEVIGSDALPSLEYEASELTFDKADNLLFSDAIEHQINAATNSAMSRFFGTDGIMISSLSQAVAAAADRFAEEMVGTSPYWCRGEVHLQPPSPPPSPPSPPSPPPSPPPPSIPSPSPPPAFGPRRCGESVCGGNWWGSFDHPGLSSCNPQCGVNELERNDCNAIYCLEAAKCCEVPSPGTCYTVDRYPIAYPSWLLCDGWSPKAYIRGLKRGHGDSNNALTGLECCYAGRGAELTHTMYSDHNKFNTGSRTSAGCPDGYLMTGFRMTGNLLANIQQFQCSKLEPSSSWGSPADGDLQSETATKVAHSASQTRALQVPKGRQLLAAPVPRLWGWISDTFETACKAVVEVCNKAVDIIKDEIIPAIGHYWNELVDCAKDVWDGQACEVSVMPEHMKRALEAHKDALNRDLTNNFDKRVKNHWRAYGKDNLARLMNTMTATWQIKDVTGGAAVSFKVDQNDLGSSSATQKGEVEFSLSGRLTMPLRVEQNMHVGPWIKMDCPKVNGTLHCPANLQPPEEVSEGTRALNALRSGVVVSCDPTVTWEATIKYNAELSGGSYNGVCVTTRPKYVTLKVTSEAAGLRSASTSEAKIMWVDLLSDRIGDMLYNLFDVMFDTNSQLIRSMSLAIESSLAQSMKQAAGNQCGYP